MTKKGRTEMCERPWQQLVYILETVVCRTYRFDKSHIITSKEGLQKQIVIEGKNTLDELKICDFNLVEDHYHDVQSDRIYICIF